MIRAGDAWGCRALALSVALCTGPLFADERETTRVTNDGAFKQRPAWSPDGGLLVFARHGEDFIHLFALDIETGSERRLTSNEHPEYDAVFAPSGQELALTYDKASPNQGDMDVHLVPLAGQMLSKEVAGTQKKLSHEESPSWSPDGQWIAYTSTFEGNQELYVMRRDGSDRRRLTTHPGIDAHPAWSPKGDRIAFATDRWGDLEVATMNVDGSDLVRMTDSVGLDDYPAWSPDGSCLAYTSNRDGDFEIYVCNASGQNAHNATRHPASDNFPTWSPQGQLTWVSNRDGSFDIYMETRGR